MQTWKRVESRILKHKSNMNLNSSIEPCVILNKKILQCNKGDEHVQCIEIPITIFTSLHGDLVYFIVNGRNRHQNYGRTNLLKQWQFLLINLYEMTSKIIGKIKCLFISRDELPIEFPWPIVLSCGLFNLWPFSWLRCFVCRAVGIFSSKRNSFDMRNHAATKNNRLTFWKSTPVTIWTIPY